MENSDAARMVGEWGCNNIILGGWATLLIQNLSSDVKEMCERLKSICGHNPTGGDLVFFIEGLQKAVKDVKKTVREEVDDEELEGAGAAV